MRFHRFFTKSLLIVGAIISVAVVVVPVVSFAATGTDTFGLNPINDTVQLGGSDLRVTVARVIKAILSVLGVIALGIVLYGGFVYMTAGGNEDKVATAKKILINGVIGLVIIMSSWGIATFVLKKLSEATGSGTISDNIPTPGSVCDPMSPNYNPAQCTNFCTLNPTYSACADLAFYAKSITPSTPSAGDKTGMSNTRIRVLFSHSLAADTNVAQAVTLAKKGGAKLAADLVSNQLIENNRVIEVRLQPEIPPGKLEPGDYTITVSGELKDTDGKGIENNYRLNDITFPLTADFTVDRDFFDNEIPRLDLITINGSGGVDLPVYIGQSVSFGSVSRDRGQTPTPFGGTGLTKVTISEVGATQLIAEAYQGPAQRVGSSPDFSVLYRRAIDAAKFVPLKQYRATVTADDIATNQTSTAVTFMVYGAHCSNNTQDFDETSLDAGGSCGGGPGASCSADNQCAPGNKCLANKCTPAVQIRNVDPMDGAVGSWITISGMGFGSTVGKVDFEVNGVWREAGIVACTGGVLSWAPTWVVVKVPEGITSAHAIRLTTGGIVNVQTDRTNDDYGPKPGGDGLFRKSDVQRPALCGVSVTDNGEITVGTNKIQVVKGARTGPVTTPVTIGGTNLGSSGTISFGGVSATALGGDLNWIDVAIKTKVPLNLQPGTVGVNVTVDGKTSNGVPFTVQSATDGQKLPVISAIDPASTTPKSYITIKGSGFSTPGTAFMAASPEKAATCITQSKDVSCQTLNVSSFPVACGATWTDTQVIAEVPVGTPVGDYFVLLRNGDQQRTDGQARLTVVEGVPRPSICALNPAAGPAPLNSDSPGLQLVGANFSTKSVVYFWQKGAVANDFDSWLNSDTNQFPNGSVIKSATDTEVKTAIPVSNSGQTMITGPIKIAVGGSFSNSVTYSVNDCRKSDPLKGYQCCATGPEAGVFKPENTQCEGEVREAGYVWRFTTGLIPELPRVIEQCNEVNWNKPGVVLEFPSPTPWEKTTRGKNACRNANISVRFSAPIDYASLVKANVKVLKCKQASNGNADCTGAVEDTNLALGIQNGVNAVWNIRVAAANGLLDANTWYRVQLSDKIQSYQFKQVLGQSQLQKFPLQKTRPCGVGTAYCFDFKTGDSTCNLAGANILPPDNTVSYLGMLQDPAFPFETNGNPMSPTHPMYYYLWGKADQECSVMSADGLGWQWTAAPTAKAAVTPAPGIEYGMTYTDSRAKVSALEQTAPEKAYITAKAPFTSNPGTGIFSAYKISPDFKSPTMAPVTFDVSKVPLLNFDKPFTLDLEFEHSDPTLGTPGTGVKWLFYRENSYGFHYFSGASANTFGLCLAAMTGKTFDPSLVCSQDVPVMGKKFHYIITWDKNVIRWYNSDGSSAKQKGWTSFKAVNNPITIDTKIGTGIQHSWTKFEITPGALSAAQVKDIFAGGGSYTATSTLLINMLDPAVVDAGPACAESCVNTNLWATFNRQMATNTFDLPGAWTVKECISSVNGACDDSTALTITDHFQVDPEISNPWHLEFSLRENRLLKPNTYYKIALGTPIKALDALQPPKLGKSLAEYTWTFRTQNNPAPCAPGSVRVAPQPFTATAVGQRTVYTAQPYSSPNACSQTGQPLSKWAYGYDWKTVNQQGTLDQQVATVTNLTTAYGVKPFCSLMCLPNGSYTNVKNPPLCGNGDVDVGEDCDIGKGSAADKAKCTLGCVYTAAVRQALGQTGSLPLASFDSTQTGQSYCGDGLITKGESCDTKIDKGCTEQCLMRGTALAATWCAVHAGDYAEAGAACKNSVTVCGNGQIEDGEMCEPNTNGADENTCNPKTCLLQNVCNSPTLKQCEAGSEGCTSGCTLAGSSPVYKAVSLCGDGIKGTGEFAGCENLANGSFKAAGPTQIVEAVGQASVVSSTKYQQTKVQASILASTTIKGQADYRLQCGYQEFLSLQGGQFNDCPQNAAGTGDRNAFGVNSGSCCALRTERAIEYPRDGAGLDENSDPVCRNTYIEARFPRRLSTGSLKDNIVLVRGYTNATTACPAGTLDVTAQMLRFTDTTPGNGGPVGFWENMWDSIKSFFRRLFGRDNAVATTVVGTINSFPLWCTSDVALTPSAVYGGPAANATTTVPLLINKALDGNATYGVWLRGGKNGVSDSTGVSIGSPDNHPGTPDDIWFFRTGGPDLCKLNEAGVTPSAYTFTQPNTSTTFVAFGKTPSGQQIVATAAYDWIWSWKPIGTPVFDIPDVSTVTNIISAKSVEGQISAVAQATVTKDLSDSNNHLGKIFSAPFELNAFFCERPWPARESFPFKDADFNLSFGYCADAGRAGIASDDLPYIDNVFVYYPTSTPPLPADTLKKYLFFNDVNDDVIGVQVFRNETDKDGTVKSLSQWYQSKFDSLGSMKPASVAGYEALSDGSNYYISALNFANNIVYQNVYLFSLNASPQAGSRTAFEKMLASLKFNTNLTDYGACLNSAVGTNLRTADVHGISSVKCTSDLQCVTGTGASQTGTNGVCSNAKTKFFRDWQRLHDVQLAQDKLDAYYATVDKILNFKADLKSGTFIPGYTTTRWPSWGTLGGLVGGLPVDPINDWVGCTSPDGQTCWNPSTSRFSCPKVSRVYEYEFVSSTGNYIFHAPLEFFTVNDSVTTQYVSTTKFSASPWQQCVGNNEVSPFGSQCGDGVASGTEQCDPPGTAIISNLNCLPDQTKTRTCTAACQWSDSACSAAGQCDNSKVEGAEVCDEGATFNGQPGHCNDTCSGYGATACGNGTLDKPVEFCEKVEDVHVSITKPSGTNKIRFKYGTDLTITKTNEIFILALNPDVLRIAKANKYCSADKTLLCEIDSDCVAPSKTQLWDLGTDLSTASQFATTNLGPCVVKPGPIGSPYNRGQSLSCGYDCKATGGYCGDKLVQTESGEQCDDANTTEKDGCDAFCQREDALACALAKPKTVSGMAVKSGGTKETPYVDVYVMENSQPINPGCVGSSATPEEICREMKVKVPEAALIGEYECLRVDVESKNGVSLTSCTGAQSSKTMAQYYEEQKALLGNLFTGLRVHCGGEIAGATDSAPAGQCGNGAKDQGEACDIVNAAGASQNGKVCTPGYGAACQYCSSDCKKILTVDPPNFCGNNIIDQGSPEVCETSSGVAYVTNTPGMVQKLCGAAQKGVYQCSNDCRVLSDSCVTCTKTDGKPIPRLSLVNPMIGPNSTWPFTQADMATESFIVSTYRKMPEDTGANKNRYKYLGFTGINDFSRKPTDSLKECGTAANQTTSTLETGKTPLLYKNLWMDGGACPITKGGIETSPMCVAEYNLFFNHRRLTEQASNPKYTLFDTDGKFDGDDSFHWFFKDHSNGIANAGDIFAFPVSGEVGFVDRQIVYSPAVPPKAYRVVVRWTDVEQKNGLEFAGGLYNANSSKATNYLDFMGEGWSTTMIKNTSKWDQPYWWPSCGSDSQCESFYSTGMFPHQITGADRTFVQAYTIDTTAFTTNTNHYPVAFFVKGLQSAISGSVNSNVIVDVYDYRDGQSGLYSVFKPKPEYSFTIKGAGGSSNNPLALYWHAFNFVYSNGEYKIAAPLNANNNGSIETDLCQVKANMPNVEQCSISP